MKAKRVVSIFVLGILLVSASACPIGPGPTPTPETSLTALPTVVMSCDQAKDAIQEALDDYHADYGEWPTANGQPGDIAWTELVPDYMEAVPANDSKCDWQVNSDPEGEVCVQHTC